VNSPVCNGVNVLIKNNLVPTAAECRELVQRVAASTVFHKSARLKELLLYIAERTLTDRRHELMEAQIGIQVFGRAETYNPGEDSIVRVSARQLRVKLNEYFQGEGAGESIGLEIPKGSYYGVFALRQPSVSTPPVEILPTPVISAPKGRYVLILLFAAAILATALVSNWVWRQPLTGPKSADTLARVVLNSLPNRTMLVLSDTGLIVAEKITAKELQLQEYVSGNYRKALEAQLAANGGPPDLARHLGVTQHTGIADAAIYGRILRAHPDLMENLSLRHARGISPRDIQTGNIILVGGPRSNPWTKLFAEQLSFEQGYDQQTQTGFILNRRPAKGETARFLDNLPAGIGFGHIALLPNSNGSGLALLIGGTTMPAKEAAGEFATDPGAYGQLLKTLNRQSLDGPHVLEVIIQCTGLAGSARDWRVVAHKLSQTDLSRRYKQ
jgi:hypothetical protein